MFIVVAIFNLKHPSAMRAVVKGTRAVGVFSMKEPVNVHAIESGKNSIDAHLVANGSYPRPQDYEMQVRGPNLHPTTYDNGRYYQQV